jgi:hypothetical protein
MGTKELDTCTCALLWYLLDDLRRRTSATWKEFGRPQHHLTSHIWLIVFHVDRMVGREACFHVEKKIDQRHVEGIGRLWL